MNILWIGPWLADAISTQVRGSMARAIHDTGNMVGTVVIGEAGSWKTGGYDWIHYCPVPKSALGKWMNQARMARTIARFNGDVLVLGEKAAQLALVASCARKLFQRNWKIIVDVRTLPIPASANGQLVGRQRRFWKQLWLGMSHADAWMAITPRLHDAVMRRVDTRSLPCLIWESAVDSSFLDYKGNSSTAERIRSCGHDINLLYLGSLAKGRRVDLAVRAMANLENKSAGVGLHIIGSGDQASILARLVKEGKLSKVVHIWNPVEYADVPSVIQACDLGILPLPDCDAWNVSSPLKLYEYMGVGRPLLVSDIPAHRHAVGGQPFAFFMNEYSIAGFNKALRRFIDQPNPTRHRLGEQARAFVRENHTYNHRAESILLFMNSLRQKQE